MAKLKFIMPVEIDTLYELYAQAVSEVDNDYPINPLSLKDLLDNTWAINTSVLPIFYGLVLDHFKELIYKEYNDTQKCGLIFIANNDDWVENDGIYLTIPDNFKEEVDTTTVQVNYDISQ